MKRPTEEQVREAARALGIPPTLDSCMSILEVFRYLQVVYSAILELYTKASREKELCEPDSPTDDLAKLQDSPTKE